MEKIPSPIERAANEVITDVPLEDTPDTLLSQFPLELQEKLEDEVANMDSATARDFLVNRLIRRWEALAEKSIDLPAEIEITNECPPAIARSLERVTEGGDAEILGFGHNGSVYPSNHQPNACYKVLHIEKAREVYANIVREALLQYKVGEVLSGQKNVARVPKVLCFVSTPDIRAIMMERINGPSLLDILTRDDTDLPDNFDINSFFEQLEHTLTIMNESGYFHRDLMNNAGNVMVDEKGEPCLVDFGSAIKSADPDKNPMAYQITIDSTPIIANDLSGVRKLKRRILSYIQTKGSTRT